MTTNDIRGEASMKLGASTILLFAKLDTLKRFEKATGKPVFGMMRRIHTGDGLSLEDMLTIITIAAAAADPAGAAAKLPATFQQAVYDEHGVAGVAAIVTHIFLAGMGGEVSEGEAAPTAPA